MKELKPKNVERIVRKWETRFFNPKVKLSKKRLYELVNDVWFLRTGGLSLLTVDLHRDKQEMSVNILVENHYFDYKTTDVDFTNQKERLIGKYKFIDIRDRRGRHRLSTFQCNMEKFLLDPQVSLTNGQGFVPDKLRSKQRRKIGNIIWQAHLSTPK